MISNIKTLLFLPLILIVFSQIACSQTKTIQELTASPILEFYHQYDGSVYLSEGWKEGSIKLVGGEYKHDLMLKLNIFNNKLLYYNKRLGKQLVIDNSIVDEVTMKDKRSNQVVYLKNIVDSNGLKQGGSKFYFVHLSDSISVWSDKTKYAEDYTSLNSNPNKVGTLHTKVKYYYLVNNELYQMPFNKRFFGKEFPNNRKAITTYISKNKLSLKNENDLIYLFKEINRLEKVK